MLFIRRSGKIILPDSFRGIGQGQSPAATSDKGSVEQYGALAQAQKPEE
jgi:hypothetical protein